MTQLVDPKKIESLVGATRHGTLHLGRWNTENDRIYILHSHKCVRSGIDLRECPYSQCMTAGAFSHTWSQHPNSTVVLSIQRNELTPLATWTIRDDELSNPGGRSPRKTEISRESDAANTRTQTELPKISSAPPNSVALDQCVETVQAAAQEIARTATAIAKIADQLIRLYESHDDVAPRPGADPGPTSG